MNEVQEFILRRAMNKVASTFTPMNNTHEYNHSTNNSNKSTAGMQEQQQHATNEPQKGTDESYAFGAPEGLHKTASLKSASKAVWDRLAKGIKGTGKLIKDHPVKAGLVGTGIASGGLIIGTGKHLQNKQEQEALKENELYGALGGTVVGAGAGAGIGALATIKASKKAKILSILLGMGAGGVAGGVGGYYAGREWGDDVRNYFAKS